MLLQYLHCYHFRTEVPKSINSKWYYGVCTVHTRELVNQFRKGENNASQQTISSVLLNPCLIAAYFALVRHFSLAFSQLVIFLSMSNKLELVLFPFSFRQEKRGKIKKKGKCPSNLLLRFTFEFVLFDGQRISRPHKSSPIYR